MIFDNFNALGVLNRPLVLRIKTQSYVQDNSGEKTRKTRSWKKDESKGKISSSLVKCIIRKLEQTYKNSKPRNFVSKIRVMKVR